MSIQELKEDPSVVINDEGNILCYKISTGREHHLNPAMVVNIARMQNEGWAIKRKLVAPSNMNGHSVQLRYDQAIPNTQPNEDNNNGLVIAHELPENFTGNINEVIEETTNRLNELATENPLTSEIIKQKFYEVVSEKINTEIKPKRKGGRPVGSKNKKKK